MSRATIYRIVRRARLVTAEPRKKPTSSYIRFQAEQPNETWQADFTHHRLADGRDAEILTWLDDHSRYALSVTAHQPVTGPTVVTTFRHATATHGIPFNATTGEIIRTPSPSTPNTATTAPDNPQADPADPESTKRSGP